MPTHQEYAANATTVIEAILPNLSDEATDALVSLIADGLMSLNQIAAAAQRIAPNHSSE